MACFKNLKLSKGKNGKTIIEIVIKKVPYMRSLLLAIGLRSVKMYWLTTVDMDKTTKVKLITRGKSFSAENISVMKNPIDWRSDAWQSEDNAAINKKGQTALSKYEILEITLSAFFLIIIFLGKLIKIPTATTNQQKAKYLRELKETKQKYPRSVSIKVSLKQFDNLIREYESLVPFGAMKREIAEREKAEAHIEMLKRKD